MSDIFDIHLSLKAKKDLKKVPLSIAVKLQIWVDAVGHYGLSEVKKIPGYHHEPLKGKKERTTLNTSEYCLSSYIYYQ